MLQVRSISLSMRYLSNVTFRCDHEVAKGEVLMSYDTHWASSAFAISEIMECFHQTLTKNETLENSTPFLM